MEKAELIAVIRGEVADLKQKLTEAKSGVKDLGNEVKTSGEKISKSNDSTKLLASSFGKMFAMVGGGVAVIGALRTVMGATNGTADAMKREMSAVREVMDTLAIAISSLDFKDLLTNLREGARAGREYANAMDELGDRINALTIRESELSIESIRLLKIGRDRTKSDKERIEALQKMIDLEAALANEKKLNAEMAFDAELSLASKKSKLTEDEIKNYLRLYDSNKAIMDLAKQYNAALAQSEKSLVQINEEAAAVAGTNIFLQAELIKTGIAAKEQAGYVVEAATEEVKAFAKIEKSMDKLSDESRKKVVGAWVAVNKTILDFETSTQRAAQTMSGLMAELGKPLPVLDKGLNVVIEPLKTLQAELLKTSQVTAISVAEMNAELAKLKTDGAAMIIDFTSFVQDSIVEMADMIGTALGAALSGKDFGLDNMIMMFADWGKRLGQILFAAGTALWTFKTEAIKNPLAVAAFGLALIAASAAVKAAVSSNPSTGVNSTYGGGSGVGSDLTGLRDLKQFSISVTGEIVAQGSNLVAVINNENKRNTY